MSKANFVYEFRVRRYRRSMAREPSTCNSPEDVAAVLRMVTANSPIEQFVAVFLDAANKVVGFEVITTGTLTGVDVHPREVFRGAILASAVAIIVGHNHPSGSVTPSPDDIALTDRLKAAGELLGIPILAHVIVTDGPAYYSIAEGGHHG